MDPTLVLLISDLNSTLTDKIHQKLAKKTGPANAVASNFHLKKQLEPKT